VYVFVIVLFDYSEKRKTTKTYVSVWSGNIAESTAKREEYENGREFNCMDQ
jgi:hypothetical protein